MEKAIKVSNITKKYKLYNDTKDRLFDLITPKSYGEDFYALTKVNFEAEHGEVIGFIGVNGSGKSTLSNIIAGIVPESSGTVQVNGQVSLIAVAAGLKNDLTGRDNIELKLLMLGFSKEEILELEPRIIDFSELGRFIDQPVKSYSSGMKSRLGFAISVNVNPDILIIDEALSVGDRAFAEKSLNKMKEFKREGKTMIFVSHSIGQMKQFCDKILWLEFGMVKDYGSVIDVIPKYENFLKKWQVMSKEEREIYRRTAFEKQEKILHGLKQEYLLEIDNFFEETAHDEYFERPVSILGHIRANKSYIYNSPKETMQGESSKKYKNKVYYIKKQATFNGDLFYLLSLKPSAKEGVIGWMGAADLSVHRHVLVDNDSKRLKLLGTGQAFNMPWGGKRNLVHEDLSGYINELLFVTKTELVGNNAWYRGTLNHEEIWIHQNHLKEVEV